jgi:seryl-tRNA synthetase
MLSIQLIRQRPDFVRANLERRGEGVDLLDAILKTDHRRRELLQEEETLRAEQNRVSREIGAQKGKPDEALLQHMREVRERIRALEGERERCDTNLNELLLRLPNLLDEDVPKGEGEHDNVVVRTWGEPRGFDFQSQPHWDLAERLGLVDFQAGVRLAGSRFYVLTVKGARLQRGLINWMLDVHTREHGYTEFLLPYLVKGEVLTGSGQLPKFADNLYHDAEEDLWLVPTAEVPLVNLHREEILAPDSLPRYYTAYTECFRREKAAAGRDTRGIKRVHQFAKVELVKLVEPDASADELESLVGSAETIFRRLGLAYRVLKLCSAEVSFAMAKTYDIEIWAPGSGEWLEASSCSNARDYQARRANIRYRRDADARPEFPHTLNGSGVALPRTMAAVLETHQRADGSVDVPEVLRPYVGIARIEPA